jgi:hypothetical protein
MAVIKRIIDEFPGSYPAILATQRYALSWQDENAVARFELAPSASLRMW